MVHASVMLVVPGCQIMGPAVRFNANHQMAAMPQGWDECSLPFCAAVLCQMGQTGPKVAKMGQKGSEWAESGQNGPEWAKYGPEWPFQGRSRPFLALNHGGGYTVLGPKWPQNTPKWPILNPFRPQNGPEWPKMDNT